MITPDNLTDLLAVPGFQKAKTVWRKTIGAALLEHSIAEAEAIIAAAPARKQAVMRHYL